MKTPPSVSGVDALTSGMSVAEKEGKKAKEGEEVRIADAAQG